MVNKQEKLILEEFQHWIPINNKQVNLIQKANEQVRSIL